MSFNFGDSPFKYEPVDNFLGLTSAPENLLVTNEKNSSDVATRKLVANAPQALIIEVSQLIHSAES